MLNGWRLNKLADSIESDPHLKAKQVSRLAHK